MNVNVNGINLHYLDEGEGAPVLMLHGFPDSSRAWRHQIPALTAAGFRCIVPDLRGFGETDAPEDVAAYAIPEIEKDVLRLLDHLGLEQVQLVAHDWGAALGWYVAGLNPDRFERYATLQVGHGANHFAGREESRQRSWYILFFLLAGIAEEALQRNDWLMFREWMDTYPDADQAIADFSRPGRLTAGLNWYRANFDPAAFSGEAPYSVPGIECNAMGIWSPGEKFLTEHQMLASPQYVEGSWRYERILGASHWVQLDKPDEVNRLLLEFLDPQMRPGTERIGEDSVVS
jgi:pimeloyl-ACP methyl ester carboxylesterase